MIGRLTTSKLTLVAGVQRDAGEHETACSLKTAGSRWPTLAIADGLRS